VKTVDAAERPEFEEDDLAPEGIQREAVLAFI
jgi:hypothetical protein